jgi:hypothetical protein
MYKRPSYSTDLSSLILSIFRFLSIKVEEKPDSVVTKVYYWEITNKDGFLYNGELPKVSWSQGLQFGSRETVKEKGP